VGERGRLGGLEDIPVEDSPAWEGAVEEYLARVEVSFSYGGMELAAESALGTAVCKLAGVDVNEPRSAMGGVLIRFTRSDLAFTKKNAARLSFSVGLGEVGVIRGPGLFPIDETVLGDAGPAVGSKSPESTRKAFGDASLATGETSFALWELERVSVAMFVPLSSFTKVDRGNAGLAMGAAPEISSVVWVEAEIGSLIIVTSVFSVIGLRNSRPSTEMASSTSQVVLRRVTDLTIGRARSALSRRSTSSPSRTDLGETAGLTNCALSIASSPVVPGEGDLTTCVPLPDSDMSGLEPASAAFKVSSDRRRADKCSLDIHLACGGVELTPVTTTLEKDTCLAAPVCEESEALSFEVSSDCANFC